MSANREENESRAIIDEQATEAAATALTALSISPKADDEDGVGSFAIPQRFTKSGRKAATPFTLKVRKFGCGPKVVPCSILVFHVLTIIGLFVYFPLVDESFVGQKLQRYYYMDS
jgi:hypothetical protein